MPKKLKKAQTQTVHSKKAHYLQFREPNQKRASVDAIVAITQVETTAVSEWSDCRYEAL